VLRSRLLVQGDVSGLSVDVIGSYPTAPARFQDGSSPSAEHSPKGRPAVVGR
jgi:hypothetical protein